MQSSGWWWYLEVCVGCSTFSSFQLGGCFLSFRITGAACFLTLHLPLALMMLYRWSCLWFFLFLSSRCLQQRFIFSSGRLSSLTVVLCRKSLNNQSYHKATQYVTIHTIISLGSKDINLLVLIQGNSGNFKFRTSFVDLECVFKTLLHLLLYYMFISFWTIIHPKPTLQPPTIDF